ncbi:lipase member H isoform X1 [Synchiropus splendidus]|uniref:lipase member H isoform X1 n=2 Tax=Synchiropus splendidus TaxID=270530 RepID=UPI00237DDA30|nr:lipase member H isoform X1 [Synchiropus splendidus]
MAINSILILIYVFTFPLITVHWFQGVHVTEQQLNQLDETETNHLSVMFQWSALTTLLLVAAHTSNTQECHNFTKLKLAHAIIGTSVRVKLLLYTRDNVNCGILLSHTNLTTQPRFNLSRPTTFILHGLRPTGSPPVWVEELTQELLRHDDHNVIVMDWNHGATNLNYFKAVENTHKAAENLTAFIRRMQEHGAAMDKIHMIGISLGAHMSGFVGAELNGTIGRITALDPAGPVFTGTPPEDRLDPSDAQFVDVLHTDIDGLGYREPLGHIDFYANGGTDQPGCSRFIFSFNSYIKCDHQRSVFLFRESVDHTCQSRALPCSSYNDYLDGKCLSCDQFGGAGCPVFGYDITKWKDAILQLGPTKAYFTTNQRSPFCMTNYRVDVVVWNEEVRWGYITVKLHNKTETAVATIDHRASEFRKFHESHLFAQFDKKLPAVDRVSAMFYTGNVFQPKYKLRVLRLRLTNLDEESQSLCRYDIVLKENTEVEFKPLPCEELTF